MVHTLCVGAMSEGAQEEEGMEEESEGRRRRVRGWRRRVRGWRRRERRWGGDGGRVDGGMANQAKVLL